MSAHSSDLALLQQIVNKIEIEPIRVGPINLADLGTLPFICAKMSPIGVVGIRVEAATALSELAASIYRNSPSYRRGVTYAALYGELVDVILANFPNRSAAPVTTADVVMVKCKIDAWFQSVAAKREYYVPCVLPPRPAPAFTVGPVSFTHGEQFFEDEHRRQGALFAATIGMLVNAMADTHVHWVATVSVDACSGDRGREWAELAVDLPLVGLQLIIGTEDARHIARMDGRTVPRYRVSVSRSTAGIDPYVENQQPGARFGDGALEEALAAGGETIEAVGRRIATFLQQTGPFLQLETSWADAAYWFREGLAEPLGTIAITKLETAIEVLLCAEKTSGSKARMLQAIEAFYGLPRHSRSARPRPRPSSSL